MIPVDRVWQMPGVCFICEQTWPDGTRYVDTQRDFDPGGYTKLNGRKYICEHCIDSARKALFPELVESDKVDKAVGLAKAVAANLDALTKELKVVTKSVDDTRKEVVKDVAGLA